MIVPAHADGLVGIVCIISTTATNGCPNAQPVITAPSPTSHILVSVFINVSSALNGFDITLLSGNTSVLVPQGVVAGTLLSNPQEVVKCIGGVNKLGSGGCPSTDTAATIHYAVSGGITGAPANGLLFQANFTVVSNTYNTPVTFQTGCTNTSVSGGVCVTIGSGSTTPNTETVQTAKVSNRPYFDIIPDHRSLTVSKGDIPNVSATVDVASVNGFSGTVNLAGSVSLNGSPSPPGVIFALVPNSVVIAPMADSLAELNVTVLASASPGNYTLTITGTSPSLPLNAPANAVTVALVVPLPDFVISFSPPAISFNVTATGKTNITITSIGNFAGNVTLNVSFPPLITGKLSNLQTSQTLKLKSKGSNMTQIFVNSTAAGTYNVTVTGMSGALAHTVPLSALVIDYLLSVPSTPATPLNVVKGSSQVETITLTANSGYNTTVKVTSVYAESISGGVVTGPSSGVVTTCAPSTIILFSLPAHSPTNSTNCTVVGVAIGTYLVTVTMIAGTGSRASNHAVSFQVNVVGPSFTMTLSTQVATVPVGSSTTISTKLTGLNGVYDNITVHLIQVTGGSGNPALWPTVAINGTDHVVATLRPTRNTSNETLTLSTGSTTPPGVYIVSLEGSGLGEKAIAPLVPSNPPNFDISFTLVVVETASPHNLGVLSVVPSQTSAAVGSSINIVILVKNFGKLAENATIIGLVGDLTVGTKNATNLLPGHNVTVTIAWDTSNFNPGSYTIAGRVLAAYRQTNTTFSTLRLANPVTLTALNNAAWYSQNATVLVGVAAIAIVAIAAAILLLSRRKSGTSQQS